MCFQIYTALGKRELKLLLLCDLRCAGLLVYGFGQTASVDVCGLKWTDDAHCIPQLSESYWGLG